MNSSSFKTWISYLSCMFGSKIRECSQLFSCLSFGSLYFRQKHIVMEVSMTSCKVLNSSQTTLARMYECALWDIAICGQGWILETTSFQATSGVERNLSSICKDLVARLQNSTAHVAEKFERLFKCCMAAHHPRRLVTQNLLSASQTLQFVFHSRAGQKKQWRNLMVYTTCNFICVEGVVNGPVLLAF